jgi:predicted TIM-barrel fold metal-dependent hydrolase
MIDHRFDLSNIERPRMINANDREPGLNVRVKVLDAHIHLPSPGWPENPSFFGTVEKSMDYLRKTGTDGAVFNTWQGVLAKTDRDIDQANTSALQLVNQFPGILYPGAVLHPDAFETSCDWLKRFRDQNLLWVGELILENHSYKYLDAPFLRLMEECAKHGHIVQLHGHTDILELAKRFPQTQFVL